jgi:hypothetical protein
LTVDHSLDSGTKAENTEIDQEAYTDSAESHVGQELGFVDWMDRFDGFHFDNYPVFNDQINSISDFEFVGFINNRQGNFRSHAKASGTEFMCEAELIGTLEKTWPEERMNLHCRIENAPVIALTRSLREHAGLAISTA